MSERLYFHHIPKTAGTSVIAALDTMFAPAAIADAQLIDPFLATPAEVHAQTAFFRGHLGARLHERVGGPLVTFTMLRDPVARTISHFRHLRREPSHPLHGHVTAPGYDLMRFTEDPVTRSLVENYQARFLTLGISDIPDEGAQLSGHPLARQIAFDSMDLPTDEEGLARAAFAALAEFDVVGTVEEGTAAALERLGRRMGWRRPAVGQRLRVAPGGDVIASSEEIHAIRDLTGLDRALVDAAAGLRLKRSGPRGWWWSPQRACDEASGWGPASSSDEVGWHRWTSGPGAVAELDGREGATADGACAGGGMLAEGPAWSEMYVDVAAATTPEALALLRVRVDGQEMGYERVALADGGQRLIIRGRGGSKAPQRVEFLLPTVADTSRRQAIAVRAIRFTPAPGRSGEVSESAATARPRG